MHRCIAAAAVAFVAVTALSAQRGGWFIESRNHPAIEYSSGPLSDPIVELNRKLRDGRVELTFEPVSGYLGSLLEALDVPRESQVSVFSPTSFQASRITMENPRTLFFNDTVSVGWVRTGPVVEIAAHDPRQGVVFYMLEQKEGGTPQLTRNDDCLACHLTRDTLGVPGLVVYSVAPLADERAYRDASVIDHRSALEDRWGGWYVTGGRAIEHKGNTPTEGPQARRRAPGGTPQLASLEGTFDTSGYLTPYSDVAALMVLEHQTHMTNLLTRMGWEARVAAHEARTPDLRPPQASDDDRVRATARELVDYLLFIDEAPLPGEPDRLRGQSGFADAFAAAGPHDRKGRSLRDLDLGMRLMRYPCSYMIYTDAFDELPAEALDAIYERMWQILSGEERGPRYTRLSRADRQAIVEILRETKPNLPDYFQPLGG
jgi:hypothetical protein